MTILCANVPLKGTITTLSETSGLVRKRILRTGEWPVTPTSRGTERRPLTIVARGTSSEHSGRIALEELRANFDARVIPNVNVPLSDDTNDHKNLTALNKGFVRKLEIERDGEHWYLVATMAITDRETRSRMLDGSYADCSAGIVFGIERKGTAYNAALDHVCITNQPFIDGLGPYMATFSERPVSAFREPTADDRMREAQESLRQAQEARMARVSRSARPTYEEPVEVRADRMRRALGKA